MENKQLRRALANIRTALFKMSEAVRQEAEGSMTEVIVNNYVGAMQRTIDSLT
jgi:cob(I)alamin adenosyltransferase